MIKLQLDDLHVESFHTDDVPPIRGTVAGHAGVGDQPQQTESCLLCGETDPLTCHESCWYTECGSCIHLTCRNCVE